MELSISFVPVPCHGYIYVLKACLENSEFQLCLVNNPSLYDQTEPVITATALRLEKEFPNRHNLEWRNWELLKKPTQTLKKILCAQMLVSDEN